MCYYAGSQRVAMRVGTVLSYLFGDHLGSTSITTDASGNVSGELRYLPFGETRYESGQTPTSFRYTGQREDSTINLYWYNSRWYDSSLGRWAQPDTLIPSPGNPMAWDRYAYVLNSPMRYSDPSGHVNEQGAGIGGGSIEDVYPGWWEHREEMIDQAMKWIAANQSSSPYDKLWIPTKINTPSTTTIEAYPIQTPSTERVPGSTPTQNDGSVFPYSVTVTANWEEADKLDVGLDIVGIGADITMIFAPEGPGEIAEAIVTPIEFGVAINELYNIAQGDQSAAQQLSVDQILEIVQNDPWVKARLGRWVPGIGSVGSLYSLARNIDLQVSIESQKD